MLQPTPVGSDRQPLQLSQNDTSAKAQAASTREHPQSISLSLSPLDSATQNWRVCWFLMSRQTERGVPRAPRLTMGSWWMYTPHFLTSSAARAQKSCLEATCFVSLFVSCNIWVNEAKSKSWHKLLVLPRWFNVLARRQVTNLTGSETCFFWKAGLANVLISHDNPYVESLQTCLPQLFAVRQCNLIFWMHQFKHLSFGGASTKLLRSGGAPTVYFCCLYSFLWEGVSLPWAQVGFMASSHFIPIQFAFMEHCDAAHNCNRVIMACGCCLWANCRIFQPKIPMQTLQQLLWTRPIQEWRCKPQKGWQRKR